MIEFMLWLVGGIAWLHFLFKGLCESNACRWRA